MHQRFGKLPWKELFGAAIAYAEQGFPVTEGIHEAWSLKKLKTDESSARVFLPDGKPPAQGEVFRNPEIAHALRLLAENGRDAF